MPLRLLQSENEPPTSPCFEPAVPQSNLSVDVKHSILLQAAMQRTSSPIGFRHNDVHIQPRLKVMSTVPTKRLKHRKLNYLPILPTYHNIQIAKLKHYASWRRIRRRPHHGQRQRNRVRREQDRRCPQRRLRCKFSPSSSVTACSNTQFLFQEPVSSGVDRSGKAAPLPEGISEMKDAPGSGSGSQGVTPGGGEKSTEGN